MHSPYGLQIIESCLTCHLRMGKLFCDLPKEALDDLEHIRQTSVYPKGAMLFVEGQASRGVYVLCNGRAKLSASSSEGKSLILKIAEPGDVLGLSATVSQQPYEVTAETLEPCNVNFIRTADFMKFLNAHGEACLRVAKLLSNSYQSAYEEIRSLGLSSSVAQRLAKLLINWGEKGQVDAKTKQQKFNLALTHEEIAQMIGTSRETVTRLFSDFKKKELIEARGATVYLKKRTDLVEMVNS